MLIIFATGICMANMSCFFESNSMEVDGDSTKTIDKIYVRSWSSTNWIISFNFDRTFSRTCEGPFCSKNVIENVMGTYKISGDSIIITYGFGNDFEGISEFYVSSGECIKDLVNENEYCLFKPISLTNREKSRIIDNYIIQMKKKLSPSSN